MSTCKDIQADVAESVIIIKGSNNTRRVQLLINELPINQDGKNYRETPAGRIGY